jgi:prepilin-type N-terminal cleavage/methylation domain-containing protein
MEKQNLKTKVKTERCGFTIAELMLVVVVIALLAGVGGGIYVGTYKRMLAEKSARDFLFAAKYARITAIERQSPCEMELDADDNRFSLLVYEFNEETERTEQVSVRDLYSRPVQFGGEIKFEDIKITPIGSEEVAKTDEEKTIVFSPNGTAQSAVIQIGDGKNHYTVSICAATGKATMHFGTAKEVETSTIDLDEEL